MDTGVDATDINAGLSGDFCAINESGLEVGVDQGHGENSARDMKHSSGFDDGKGHAAREFGEGGEHQIAEAVALKVLAAVEAVVQEAAEDGVVGVVGAQAQEALAYVSGRELA